MRTLVLFALVSAVLLDSAPAQLPDAAQAQPLPELFPPADQKAIDDPDAKQIVAEPGFKQAAIMRINTDAILNAKAATIFGLSIFDLENLTITLKEVDSPSGKSRAWLGTIDGSPDTNHLKLVIRRDPNSEDFVATGTIHMDDGRVFEIRFVKTTIIVLREIDVAKIPESHSIDRHQSHSIDRHQSSTYDRPLIASQDVSTLHKATTGITTTPHVVSVAVFYTKLARIEDGGTLLIEGRIEQAVLQTQDAFDKSEINVILYLAHMAETYDTESGGHPAILARLKHKTDGPMDEVHGERKLYAADLVALFCKNGSKGGYAYRMKVKSVAHRHKAFCTVHFKSATRGYSFSHELGHLFGCCHDNAHLETDHIFRFAYGWHFIHDDTMYRSVMATGKDWIRTLRYSNPDIEFPTPGGVPIGHVIKANNARTINETADTVSMFSDSL